MKKMKNMERGTEGPMDIEATTTSTQSSEKKVFGFGSPQMTFASLKGFFFILLSYSSFIYLHIIFTFLFYN